MKKEYKSEKGMSAFMLMLAFSFYFSAVLNAQPVIRPNYTSCFATGPDYLTLDDVGLGGTAAALLITVPNPIADPGAGNRTPFVLYDGTGTTDTWTTDANGTGSGGTGPADDDPCDNDDAGNGFYMYHEASGALGTDSTSAFMEVDLTNIAPGDPAVFFHMSYHMFGTVGTMGDLYIEVDDGTGKTIFFRRTGPQQIADTDDWIDACVNLAQFHGQQVTVSINYSPQGSFQGDAAVDNIYLAQAATDVCRIDLDAIDMLDGTMDGQVVFPMSPGMCADVPNTLPAATVGGDCLAAAAGAVVMDDAPATFTPGSTTVTYWTEGAGTPKATTINVVVADQEAPVIACPAAPAPFDLLPGECGIVVSFDIATFVSDNCTLGTTNNILASNSGSNLVGDGYMFDVTNLTISDTILIEDMLPSTSTNFFGNAAVQVTAWVTTTDNTFVGNETNMGAWTQIGNTFNGVNQGGGNLYSTGIGGAKIPPGESRGIYIETRIDQMHGGPGANTFSDGVLEISNGRELNSFFGGFFTNNVSWFGEINYTLLTSTVPTYCADSPQSGDVFEVGTTEVCFMLDDAQGNTGTCDFDIIVNSFPDATTTLACNDNVQVSLDEDNSDCTVANTDIVLEGGPYGCYVTDYTAVRTPAASGCPRTDPTRPGDIYFNCNDIGKTITIKVTDDRTGSYCWGTVIVEDKISPVLECPDYTVDCNASPAPVFISNAGVAGASSFSTLNTTFGVSTDVVVPINVGVFGTITDVNLYTNLTHPDIDNFALFLRAPDGTEIEFFNPDAVGFTCGGDDNIDVLWDDEAPNAFNGTCPLPFGTVPIISGTFGSQFDPFSTFDGLNAAGTWEVVLRFVVGDFEPVGDRIFNELRLDFEYTTLPTVTSSDNCSVADLTFLDASETENCASGLVSSITRTWKATDASGNSTLCTQNISVDRPTLADVSFPGGTTVLDCSSDYPDPGVEVCVKDTVTFAGLNLFLPDGPTAATFASDPDALVVATFDIDAGADASRSIKDLNIAIELAHGDISEAQVAIARLNSAGNVIASSVTVLYTADLADGYVQCSNPIQQNFNIIFDDEGCAMPHEGCTNFAPSIKGQYIPFEALSSLDGGLVNANAGDDYAILYRDLDGPVPSNTTNGTGILQSMEITYLYQDADVIGTPTVSGGNFETGDICGLTASYTDERIDVCPTTYKIVRTWTVIDWCSGDKTVTDQLIKIEDSCPPVLDVPNTVNDDQFTWDINVYQPSAASSGAHHVCTGDANLPPLDICSENCSGVDATTWSTSLYSADGTTLLGTVNTNGGTFSDLVLDLDEGQDDDKAPGTIVLPDLSTPFLFDSIRINVDSETLREPDAIYLAKYKVSDNCGNSTEAEIFIRLLDKIPPVPVVREETQLALTGGAGDTTTLCAADLDEGSYDNCGGTHFFIRKMLNDNDTDPIGNLDFGFGPDPTLTFEIFGRDGVGTFDLARDFVYKSCTSFTCADIGTDNQVFVLVVDDYVVNFINDYLDSVFEFIDAIVDYSVVPLTILPDDTLDDEEDEFTFNDDNGDGVLSQDEVRISVDRDRRNGGQRNFEFYLNEDPRADNLFIIHTAILWEGHFNFAMVNVHVEDKVRPECEAPEDVWTTCDKVADNSDLSDAATLDGLFGSAIATDNCNATIEELSPTVNVDLCGVGSVTRRWRAEDDYGNRSLGSCTQTIMIMAVNEYTITVPADFEEECDDASPADLTYEEIGCDLLAVSREVEEFPVSAQGECKKMVITWKVINWCEYDGASAAIELPRQNFGNDNLYDSYSYASDGAEMTSSRGNIVLPSSGYYSYIQHVKIFDNTAPDVSYDGDTTFCGGDQDEDPCTGLVEIDPDRSDLCTNTSMTWELDAFSDSFNEADFDGGGGLSTRLPLGTHTVRFYVDDECGNTSYLTITFTVVDCKAPTPVCHNGLSIDVMPLSGMVELWASDFDASSFDYCSPFELRANVVEDKNNDGVINADDYETSLPTTTNIVVDCDDVAAGLTMVQLWVAEQDGDDDANAADNQDNDYCVTFVEVQDNNGVCSPSPKAAIGGKVANEAGESVQDVTVEINNGSSSLTSSMVTDATGEYDFRNLPLGGDYTVAPMRLDDAANGVSTFDLIKISRHILNVELLDSPYKIIAADANNSDNISTVDLIAIRKVILRVADEFPNNTSWRFVDKGYTFADASKPLAENFAEVINRNNLDAPDFAANFVAIKVGDVNGDATPNSILGVDGRTFNGNMILNASEQSVEAGEEFTVEFTAAQDVDGYQFTLDYNEKAVELVDVVDGLATEAANFNVAEGQIATSWNQDVSTKGQVMFSLVFRAKDAIEVSNVMSVNSAITAAEAYGVNGELMGISLEFDGAAATAQFELAQNTPNPFKTETVIGFTLPEASNATLTVSDVTGKVLKVVTGDFAKGYNQISMKRADVGVATGVLSYRLEANGNTATKQMIVIE